MHKLFTDHSGHQVEPTNDLFTFGTVIYQPTGAVNTSATDFLTPSCLNFTVTAVMKDRKVTVEMATNVTKPDYQSQRLSRIDLLS